ncbi:MAG TPA: hypothetical protein DGL25_05520 [Dehalococcoidia bacterium]|nr:hypothetical protein [Dehalococcoidia bacterium]|tara:strand:+ start:205 stop:423 length:219 start_codon:yes stop_codon:yes gene_type:complete
METEPALRVRFERERRRAAFYSALAGGIAGIIIADMWVAPELGVVGGFLGGIFAYATIFAYETVMWRRNHGV